MLRVSLSLSIIGHLNILAASLHYAILFLIKVLFYYKHVSACYLGLADK